MSRSHVVARSIPLLIALASCRSSSSNDVQPLPDASEIDAADASDAIPDTEKPGPWATAFPWKLASPATCPTALADDDLLKKLLGNLKLTVPLGIPKSFYDALGGAIADDPARLSHFHTLQADATQIPCFAGNMALRADAAVTSDHPIASMIANAATQLDLTLTVGGPWQPIDATSPLVAALDALEGDPSSWARDEAVTAAAKVPLPVQRAAARVLLASIEAKALRDEGLASIVEPGRWATVFQRGSDTWLLSTKGGLDPDSKFYGKLFESRQKGWSQLHQGAVRVAQAIDEADWTAATTKEPFEFFATTPLGAVVLRGGGDDVYDETKDARLKGALLLVVDTGGNDTYRIPAGATRSIDNPIAVHVDLGGNDSYGYAEKASPYDKKGLLPSDAEGRYVGDDRNGNYSLSEVARQGAGILGYGFLVDRGGGDDVYLSHRKSQGFANFGVGVLWDDGGKDRYEAENGAQGCALVGVALLYDGGGSDTYRSFGNSQGFGWVGSFGTLYDAAGDDKYELVVDEVILFDSPQTPKTANSSLGQGTAFGWRRDATGTHLGGGLALLRDKSGNDRYDGATFVQGTGYWMGLGVLADAEGDDRYNGLFYAQGAGAHFALGAFLDGAGNDNYDVDRPAIHSAIGLGHDFSVVVFVDESGNDRYQGPDRGTGAGKCHGMGLFFDLGGDDVYRPLHDRSIGWATDYDWAIHTCGTSTTLPTYGLFVDASGRDEYTKPSPSPDVGDSKSWISDDLVDPDARELGGGIDADSGVCFAHAYGATWATKK